MSSNWRIWNSFPSWLCPQHFLILFLPLSRELWKVWINFRYIQTLFSHYREWWRWSLRCQQERTRYRDILNQISPEMTNLLSKKKYFRLRLSYEVWSDTCINGSDSWRSPKNQHNSHQINYERPWHCAECSHSGGDGYTGTPEGRWKYL